MSEVVAQPVRVELVKGLGLLDATMIVMGSMIGSGIFIVSADIARQVGSPGLLLTVWVVTGVLTVMGALSYGELAAAMPQAGGQYVFLREAFGPLSGFLYGWAMFVVIQTGTIAAVAVGFAKFLGVFVPWIAESNVLLRLGHIPFTDRALLLTTQNLVAIASILLLTGVNCRGLRVGALVQDLFTITKTAALLGLIVLGGFLMRNANAWLGNFSDFWRGANWSLPTAQLVGVAMVGSLFASDAWNNVTFTAAEVHHPQRNLPLAMALGTGAVSLLYVLANFAYLAVLPLEGIQHAVEDRVGSAAGQAVFGSAGLYVMASAIMISTFGCNNGLILAGARIYYAMAKDGLFFRRASVLNPRFHTPNAALVAQGIWTSVLTLGGTYGQLLDYIMFSVLVFYVITIAGLFVLRWQRPGMERPYKAWGYPVVPFAYMVLVAYVALVIFLNKPAGALGWRRLVEGDAARGLLLVLLGIPVYFIWRLIQRRNPAGSVSAS